MSATGGVATVPDRGPEDEIKGGGGNQRRDTRRSVIAGRKAIIATPRSNATLVWLEFSVRANSSADVFKPSTQLDLVKPVAAFHWPISRSKPPAPPELNLTVADRM